MKCIKCGKDNNLKDRKANKDRCYYCGHQFAFEKKVPTENAKFTCLFFANVLNSISAQKTLFFTSKKLGYFLDKRLKPKYSDAGYRAIFILIFFNIWFTDFVGIFPSMGIGNISFSLPSWIINLLFVISFYQATISEDNNYKIRKTCSGNLIIYGIFILVIGICVSIPFLNSFLFFALFTLLGIDCSRYSNLKERIANNDCGDYYKHNFALKPIEMKGNAKFTDTFFAKVLSDISADNTLFFTRKQFDYFLDKQLKIESIGLGEVIIFICLIGQPFFMFIVAFFLAVIRLNIALPLALWIINLLFIMVIYKQMISEYNSYQNRKYYSRMLIIYGIFFLVVGIYLSITLWNSFLFFALFTLFGMRGIYLGIINQINRSMSQLLIVSQSEVAQWLNRWQEINGSLYYLLSSPNTEQFNPVNLENNSYSFDRAIICDKPEIAQFLIRNNFHFENNCAVLSIDGYPQEIFNTVMEMLKRNPDLQVYGLHDASPKGVSLIYELRNNEQWFKDSSVNIYDLGISPRQILKNPKYVILNSPESAREAKLLPSEIKANLTPEELIWLESGNFVELESFSSKSLLRIITRGISISPLDNGNQSFITLEDNSSLAATGGSIYGVDSFG